MNSSMQLMSYVHTPPASLLPRHVGRCTRTRDTHTPLTPPPLTHPSHTRTCVVREDGAEGECIQALELPRGGQVEALHPVARHCVVVVRAAAQARSEPSVP